MHVTFVSRTAAPYKSPQHVQIPDTSGEYSEEQTVQKQLWIVENEQQIPRPGSQKSEYNDPGEKMRAIEQWI